MNIILSAGLMVSIYFSFQVFPANIKIKHQTVGRTTILVIIAYILFVGEELQKWQGEILFMDGIQSKGIYILSSEIYQMLLILGILNINLIYSNKAETYLIQMTNIIGFIYLWQSQDWIVTVIAWELFNLSLYLQVSMNSKTEAALSASIKYFLLSALSTSFLLLGVAILYGLTGSTNYDSIKAVLTIIMNKTEITNQYILPITQIILTLLFKLGAAPFYNWAPDLYESIPTPITVWMTTIVKISILIFILQPAIASLTKEGETIIIIAGLLSLIVGSVGLGAQWRMKRFLAYSAISHLGFILQAFASSNINGTVTASLYYIIIYGLTTISVFAIQCVIGKSRKQENIKKYKEEDNQNTIIKDTKAIDLTIDLQSIAGLYKQNPALTLAFSLCFFSFAGKKK